MKTSEAGIALIKEFEGCKLAAYLDSVGVPTIGVGHTAGVRIGDTCTDEEADEWLRHDIGTAERCVANSVKVELTQGQFDALVSFAFNLGCRALGNATLLRKLNAGDDVGASAEFARWSHAGGVQLDGLVRRREAERELFLA